MEEQLDQNVAALTATQDTMAAEIEVDVSQLDDAYPIIVDEKLMVASGGEIGLIRLLEWQEKEIFEMLLYETGNLSKELSGG